MKCTSCGVVGVPVYRTGKKGKGLKAMWKCEKCLKTPPDKETKELVDDIVKALEECEVEDE